MKNRNIILLIGMNLLWAGSYSIFKVLSEQLDSGAIASLRFAMAGLLLLAAWPWLGGQGPRWRELPRIFLMGTLVFCVAPRLQVAAVHLGKAGDTSLLTALDPLIVASAAALFLGERVPTRRWWGCGLGMLGVFLLSNIWRGDVPLHGLLPNALFIMSMMFEAAYSVCGKPLLHKIGAMKLLASGLAAGTLVNAILELFAPGQNAFRALPHLSAQSWIWLLYLSVICTIVGYTLWYVVIRETEVNLAGLTVLTQPVAGWILSVIWLKEPLHAGQLWGALAIVAGLIVGLRPRRETPIARSTESAEQQLADVEA
ncbi:MAG TPA: DMT family transporter [Verrucomicrobiae bacterium]